LRSAEYNAASPGAIITATIHSVLFKEPAKLTELQHVPTSSGNSHDLTSEKLVFQGAASERMEHHKNLVREEFARKRSVFILVPTIRDAERFDAFLSRGIPDFVYTLTTNFPEKEMRRRWNAAVSSKHPLVLIATGSFLSIPRSDLGTIVVERENTTAYKSLVRPFVDMRLVAERLAEELRIRFILADLPLRVESVYRFRESELDERAPLRVRAIGLGANQLVDMRELKSTDKRRKFVVLSDELLSAVSETLSENQNVFLLTTRRGLSPMTVCEDCGNAVLCDITKTPVILHKGPKGNVFVCHSCGAIRAADERCRFCGSWKLQSLGIGSEMVEELVKETYPDTEIISIDKDHTPNHKEALRAAAKFEVASGAILLGTEMALAYLPETVPVIGIVSIDSLLSLPEWNAYERVFAIIMRLRSVASKKLIIQSRKTEAEVLGYALGGNTNDFFKSEIDGRKEFGYPPFTTFIKITSEGTAAQVNESMKEVERMFAPFGWSGRSHLMHIGKSAYAMHGFLRIERKEWPKAEIVALLQTLPPSITVNVDPDSIL
jgi:primosomal protein N' (replication factor Y)